MAAPLGAVLAGVGLERLREDESVHARSLSALAERFDPDILFPLLDLSPFIENAASSLRQALGSGEISLQTLKGRDALLDEAADIEPEEAPALLAQVRVMEEVGGGETLLRAAFLPGPFHLACAILGLEELVFRAASDDTATAMLAMDFATRFLGSCAGALAERLELVMLVEPELSTLYPPLFRQLCRPYLEGLCGVIRSAGASPFLRVAGDCEHLLEELMATGAEGLSLDQQVDLRTAARTLPLNLVIMGNLDTKRLARSSPVDVHDKVSRLVSSMSGYRNFVISTAGEVDPSTPLENLEAFFAAARP